MLICGLVDNHLAIAYPRLGAALMTLPLADLPTPVSSASVDVDGNRHDLLVKRDDLTATAYGGNKVRKLEYVLRRAADRGAKRIATFGAVGSNHAVATALYAKQRGFECTSLLSHQSLKPGLGRALRFHQQNGTEVVRFGGSRDERVATMRRYFQGRRCWVVPLGGSSWLGTVGFVNAGLELAAQIDAGDIACPSRVYVALGTMGTAAGLALGFALAGLATTVHAVRVTDDQFANEPALQSLMQKTAALMRHYDASVPRDLEQRARIECRHAFFGDGYGRSNPETEAAIAFAERSLGLTLESTYSGKAMAAVLDDLKHGLSSPVLFWNTYNSRPLEVDDTLAPDFAQIPEEFSRYFD